jgi:glycosyltransferase involved in cell wall biosynthesis
VIRVAFVIGRLNIGGAEAELVRVARGLDRTKYLPFVITLQDAGPLAADLPDVEVFSLGRKRKWSWGTYRALARTLAEMKADIVQSFLFTENVFCRRIGQGIVVSGLQGSLSDNLETGPSLKLMVERSTFDRAAAVVSNSEYYRSLYGRLGFDTSKIHVIRSGVTPRTATGAGIRAQFGIRENEVLVTCVARLVERKGHEDLIRAASGLRLLFVGDGPYVRHLVSRGAILAGPRRDVPEILAASDIVALPSRFGEGCPNALLEAMAAGKPVVAARSGGIPEVVKDGETGILHAPWDVDALREALLRLAGDVPLRLKMGSAGRERALSEFSLDRLVGFYEDLYSKLTSARSPG